MEEPKSRHMTLPYSKVLTLAIGNIDNLLADDYEELEKLDPDSRNTEGLLAAIDYKQRTRNGLKELYEYETGYEYMGDIKGSPKVEEMIEKYKKNLGGLKENPGSDKD